MTTVTPTPVPRPPAPPGTPRDLGPDTAVLFFGNDWTAENRTSSHQLARQLARRFRLFYVECPGWRAPRGSGRDLKKVFVKLWRFLRGTRTLDDGVKLRTLFQLPFHRFAAVRAFNRLVVKATVKLMMWRHGVKAPLTWFHVPHVPFLVGALGERLAVYYCIDDYAGYPGVNPQVMRAMDDDTTRRADVVFLASDTLEVSKKAINPNVHVSPHGVEFDHFARAQDESLPVPEEVARFDGPVIGYFGLIESFTDLELIDWLAGQRPDWQFVFIGRVAVPDDALPKRVNVHFLGNKPYADLPGYAKRFDACVMPYKAGAWSHHANPIKLREYLSTGKPVVSVDIPQARKFADVVGIAADREQFLAKLEEALATTRDPDAVRRRMDRVRSATWTARADEVVHTLKAQLESRE